MAGMHERALISVVDDDESVLESLPALLETLGFTTRAFASAGDFLASDVVARTRCLISDVSMPVMSGPQLQYELRRRGVDVPIVFITGQNDPNLRATLLAEGAVDCLLKPFSEQALLSALNRALGRP
jgi:FixJ family two-component response regulator